MSTSLAALIRAHVFVEHPGDVDVEFHSPSADDPVKQGRRPLILVYLYRVAENPYLRNAPPELVRTPKGFVRQAAPVAVDLLYMMVAYAQNPETELILIDGLKRLFADVPALEGDALKGGLREAGNVRIGLAPDDLTLDQIHQVWASFPNKGYRLSLFYVASPVLIPRATREPVDRVLEVQTRVRIGAPGGSGERP
ncbi:MAG: DUF4255 domain-containing protein [Myxococcaceae bacterium]|nr:DUF4255 domain-containing protein [Myxococcaceae bacterium]